MTDMVNHPPHYKGHPSRIECIAVTRGCDFDTGNAIKYVWRRNDKGATVEDLRKARWYLNDGMLHSTYSILPEQKALLVRVAEAEPDQLAAAFYLAAALRGHSEMLVALGSMILRAGASQ